MAPNRAISTAKTIRLSSLAAVGSLTILSWPEALNASRSKRACRMAIRRNARSLPDFPEFAQQLRMVSPELLRDGYKPGLPRYHRPRPDTRPDQRQGRSADIQLACVSDDLRSACGVPSGSMRDSRQRARGRRSRSQRDGTPGARDGGAGTPTDNPELGFVRLRTGKPLLVSNIDVTDKSPGW